MSPRATPLAPDERRRAIVEAVVPLLLEKGSAPTTREIAAAAGIAEGTIFRAFPDMGTLWWAVLREVLDPTAELAELAATIGETDDLRATVVAAARQLAARSDRTLTAIMAVRALRPHCRPDQDAEDTEVAGDPADVPSPPSGPPTVVREANQALVAGLTDLLTPFRDELAVDPHAAAVVLRSLVLGTRHPGAGTESHLSPELVADVMLSGVTRSGATGSIRAVAGSRPARPTGSPSAHSTHHLERTAP